MNDAVVVVARLVGEARGEEAEGEGAPNATTRHVLLKAARELAYDNAWLKHPHSQSSLHAVYAT